MGQFTIIISSDTADATKLHVALVNGFALVKVNPENKVDFILMAENAGMNCFWSTSISQRSTSEFDQHDGFTTLVDDTTRVGQRGVIYEDSSTHKR
eukprot:scaffold15458_cov66-Phaeocystis_antarctica.AAC.1